MMLPIVILKGILILVIFVATWYLSIYSFIFSSGNFSSIIFSGNICGGNYKTFFFYYIKNHFYYTKITYNYFFRNNAVYLVSNLQPQGRNKKWR